MTDRERALRDAIRRGDVHYDARRQAYWQRTEDGGCDLLPEDAATVRLWMRDFKACWRDGSAEDRIVIWEGQEEE